MSITVLSGTTPITRFISLFSFGLLPITRSEILAPAYQPHGMAVTILKEGEKNGLACTAGQFQVLSNQSPRDWEVGRLNGDAMGNGFVQSVLDPFTQREHEILHYITDGFSDREIAQELFLSLNTVKWYNRQIYSKLGVGNRRLAANRARNLGLLEVSKEQGTFPAMPGLARHNLPAQFASFVGREREMAEIWELLQTTRLLTLSGPPGTGKTRLAVRLAEEVLDDYQHGVFYVDLSPIRQPELVAATIATVLNIQEAAGQPISAPLLSYLGNKELLLLLDNFEHVMKAAPLVLDMLSAAPRLKILVTSREALRLYGEQEYPVPPLALPNLDSEEPPSTLLQYESVALFVQRARAVKPDFSVPDEDATAVAGICARLDGLPLAIELAAAHAKLFSPEVLLGHLSSGLSLLQGGPRGLQ
jgi:DNA-binding CsgD family transcriptional regulator